VKPWKKQVQGVHRYSVEYRSLKKTRARCAPGRHLVEVLRKSQGRRMQGVHREIFEKSLSLKPFKSSEGAKSASEVQITSSNQAQEK
jgi:hypothetical protein